MSQPKEGDPWFGFTPDLTGPLAAALIRGSVEGILAFDRDCRYTVWNPAMERISGIPAAEVLGRCAFEVFPFLKEIGEDRYFHAALAGESAVTTERPFAVRGTGRTGFFEGHYLPLRDRDGQITGGLAIIRDVSPRLQAVSAQQQVIDILDRVTDGFCAHDREWRYTYLNQEAAKLLPRLGRSREELIGKRIWDEFPDLLDSVLHQEYQRAIAEQVPVQFELYYPPLAAWLEIRAYPSEDGLSVFFRDTTEQKRQLELLQEQREELAAAHEELQAAYEELQAQHEELQAVNEELQAQHEELIAASEEIEAQREELEVTNEELQQQQTKLVARTRELLLSERRFRAIFEQKLGFLAILERDGTLIDCNQLPLDVGGFTRDQVLGRPFWDTAWWQGLPASQEVVRRDLTLTVEGGTAQRQLPYRIAQGEERVVEYSMAPVRDDSGKVVLLTVEGRDVTERVRAEERQRFLATATEILTSSLDYELTLERVARHALPMLADVCMVELVGPDGRLERVTTAHRDPLGEALLRELRQRFPLQSDSPQPSARAYRSGETVVVAETTDDQVARHTYNPEHAELIRKIDLRSFIAVPLVARGRSIGVISFGLVGARRCYRPEEVALAEELARRAALAVDNARLYHLSQTELAERKKAEQAVRESDARLQFALEAAGMGFWDLDLETHAAHRSLQHDQIFGYETLLPEWTYEMFLEHVHPEDRDYVHQEFLDRVAANEDWEFECRIYRADGRMRWIWAHGRTYQTRDGRPSRMLGIVSDITERKALEEALRGSEERYRSVVENVQDIIFQTDADGNWVLLNSAWTTATGFPLEESLGHCFLEFVHAEDREAHADLFRLLVEGRRDPSQHEVRYRHRDGGFRWLEVRANATRDTEGRLTGIFGTLRDVTEQKRLVHDLREAQLRFQAIFNQTTTFLGILNREGVLTEVNQAPLDACGLNRAEVLGRPFWDTPWWNGSSEAQALLRADFERALLGETVRREVPYFNFGSSEPQRWVDRCLTPIRDHEDRVVLINAEGRDITERKQLDDELERRISELAEADRQKHEFLAMLSHELRNPLAPIQNTLVILRTRLGQDPSLQHSLDVMHRQVQNLTRLVDDLLDVSRITRGLIDLRLETMDLRSTVEFAVQTSRPALDAREHELSLSLPSYPLLLQGDPTRLEQVITNLLTNAAKYTDAGGSIRVAAGIEEEMAVIRVRDSGRGIPKEMLPRIFDLFTQVDPTLDRTQGGLGLGLTLVRRLAEMHGGTVSVASDGPGHGSEFTVRLPLLRTEASGADPSVASAALSRTTAKQTLRVLIVDDNQDAAETLAELLQMWGHQVHLAHEGRSAIDAALTFEPDLVLLDIGLPVMDGYEVARRLRNHAGDRLRLVAVTGYGQETDRRRAQAAGFQHHLVKPVDLEELRSLLATSED